MPQIPASFVPLEPGQNAKKSSDPPSANKPLFNIDLGQSAIDDDGWIILPTRARDVPIERLLDRAPVTLNTKAIEEYIYDKVVMVSGAGGSIGSEMCWQIARFRPRRIVLVERTEFTLFEINRNLIDKAPQVNRVQCLVDITDAAMLRRVLREERPAAIFHAAAYKHVPMLELNPAQAIRNNIVGTRTLADAAVEAGVEIFVMVSTDKAVNPTSVMGCSKRIAEMYVQQLSAYTDGRTSFVTVRFGNVLGSSGSVIPIFKEQIARGGPVFVTHPDMTRYFMTIPEAAQLVLQAGCMGHDGEIFVLDMGEPVRIVDLAENLITQSGLRPYIDIKISFTGIRPGEKLYEELSSVGEDISRTDHPRINITKKRPENFTRVCDGIAHLTEIAGTASPTEIRMAFKDVLPEYTPTEEGTTKTFGIPNRNQVFSTLAASIGSVCK